MDKRTVYEYTEPMLTEGNVAEKYAHAAVEYNKMASACGFVGVPATLHAALYDTQYGDADIRTAVKVCHDMSMELADGLVTLMLVCRMRQEFGVRPIVALANCGNPGEAGRATCLGRCTLHPKEHP